MFPVILIQISCLLCKPQSKLVPPFHHPHCQTIRGGCSELLQVPGYFNTGISRKDPLGPGSYWLKCFKKWKPSRLQWWIYGWCVRMEKTNPINNRGLLPISPFCAWFLSTPSRSENSTKIGLVILTLKPLAILFCMFFLCSVCHELHLCILSWSAWGSISLWFLCSHIKKHFVFGKTGLYCVVCWKMSDKNVWMLRCELHI